MDRSTLIKFYEALSQRFGNVETSPFEVMIDIDNGFKVMEEDGVLTRGDGGRLIGELFSRFVDTNDGSFTVDLNDPFSQKFGNMVSKMMHHISFKQDAEANNQLLGQMSDVASTVLGVPKPITQAVKVLSPMVKKWGQMQHRDLPTRGGPAGQLFNNIYNLFVKMNNVAHRSSTIVGQSGHRALTASRNADLKTKIGLGTGLASMAGALYQYGLIDPLQNFIYKTPEEAEEAGDHTEAGNIRKFKDYKMEYSTFIDLINKMKNVDKTGLNDAHEKLADVLYNNNNDKITEKEMENLIIKSLVKEYFIILNQRPKDQQWSPSLQTTEYFINQQSGPYIIF